MGILRQYMKVLIMVLIAVFTFAEDKITIYYGIERTPGTFNYEFRQLTSKKLEISREEMETYVVLDIDFEILSDVIKIKKYSKIKSLVKNSIKNAELKQCTKIWNPDYGISKYEAIIVTKKVHSEIIIDGKQYCMVGETPILEYLNENYNLHMEWEAEVSE